MQMFTIRCRVISWMWFFGHDKRGTVGTSNILSTVETPALAV
jgi:hypothetical protein